METNRVPEKTDNLSAEEKKRKDSARIESRETEHGVFYGPIGGQHFYGAKELHSAEKSAVRDEDHDTPFRGQFYNMEKFVKMKEHREEARRRKQSLSHVQKSQATPGSLKKSSLKTYPK